MLRLIPFKLAQDPSTLAANWNIVSANWLKRCTRSPPHHRTRDTTRARDTRNTHSPPPHTRADVYVRLLPARTNAVADKTGAPLPPAKPVGFVRQIVPFFATFFVSAIWHVRCTTAHRTTTHAHAHTRLVFIVQPPPARVSCDIAGILRGLLPLLPLPRRLWGHRSPYVTYSSFIYL